MTRSRGRPGLVGLALGLILAFAAQTSRAASVFEIDLIVNGITTRFDQYNPYNTTPGTDTINLDATSVTGYIHSILHIPNLSFTANLTATLTEDSGSATLIQSGTAAVSSGSVSFSVVAIANDYSTPTGNMGSLLSTLGGSYTTASLNSTKTSGLSYFDQFNGALFPPYLGSVFTTPQSYINLHNGSYGDATPAQVGGFPVAPFYALSNQVNITLGASGSKTGYDQYTLSTTLTAIPEPASAMMLMSALPIAFGLVRRYRRGVKASA